MRNLLVSTFLLGALAAPGLAADEPHNHMRGTATGWVSRFTGANSFYVGRFDDMAARGIPPVVGGRLRLYDFKAATQDTFNLVIFVESAAGSNVPSSSPQISVGPNPLKGGWVSVKLSAPPIFIIPAGLDTWLGVQFLQALVSSDGGYIYILRGDSTSGTDDQPGRRQPNTGNSAATALYAGGGSSTSGPSPSSLCRTVYAEWLHDDKQGVGGYAVAKTNQTEQKGISGDQIIGGFNSGRNPDVTGHNTGRQDDFGFEVQGSLAVNKPVVFFVAAQYGPPIPLNTGVFCLDLGTMIPLGVVVGDASGMATVMLPNALGQALVAQINNPDIFWGAVIVDTQNNQLIGTPCAQTRL